MKITDIQTAEVGGHGFSTYVRVYTDEGLTGTGECIHGRSASSVIIQEMKRLLVGEDPMNVDPLFEKLGYTPEDWRVGSRVVPRVYLMNIPERWRDKYSKEISIKAKKRIFFRVLAPLVLRTNELLLLDRARLGRVAPQLKRGEDLSGEAATWLTDIARTYGVIGKDETAGHEV